MPSDHPLYGFPYPGYYLLDEEGVVTGKFFNKENNDRFMSANILVRQFGAKVGERQGEAKSKHLTLEWSATNTTLRPGQRSALVLHVKLKPGMHLYAPGDHEYISVDWPMEAPAGTEILEVKYPQAEMVNLPVIKQTVPVYEGSLELVRDIHLLGGSLLPDSLEGQDSLEIQGEFKYQACDDKACYLPATIPLKWTFTLAPHDLERVPEEIRRGAQGS